MAKYCWRLAQFYKEGALSWNQTLSKCWHFLTVWTFTLYSIHIKCSNFNTLLFRTCQHLRIRNQDTFQHCSKPPCPPVSPPHFQTRPPVSPPPRPPPQTKCFSYTQRESFFKKSIIPDAEPLPGQLQLNYSYRLKVTLVQHALFAEKRPAKYWFMS